jgi:hypothetical protein
MKVFSQVKPGIMSHADYKWLNKIGVFHDLVWSVLFVHWRLGSLCKQCSEVEVIGSWLHEWINPVMES